MKKVRRMLVLVLAALTLTGALGISAGAVNKTSVHRNKFDVSSGYANPATATMIIAYQGYYTGGGSIYITTSISQVDAYQSDFTNTQITSRSMATDYYFSNGSVGKRYTYTGVDYSRTDMFAKPNVWNTKLGSL
ncbi:MAG: hypothetical protein LBQ91_06890 [Oscillospiraceae bacterium]|jgi:hypothetical protein|nr:hypothetical protein [Oscillospiraceae bacterium]